MSANWQHRWHPLRSEWVQISAQSANRPWSGATVDVQASERAPRHDPDCYLCPGVTRANGQLNPEYADTFAFDNDFACLVPHPQGESSGDLKLDPLRCSAPPTGRCRVLCWTPRHDLTLADFDDAALCGVVQLWHNEYNQLAADPDIAQVTLFENKGVEVGVSNLHPHGQVYASAFVTDTAKRERAAQASYLRHHSEPLLQALIARPEYREELAVASNAHWVAIVPYFARFPFEVWCVPRRHVGHVGLLTDTEQSSLASLYGEVLRRLDVLFNRRTPHNTMLHNAPCDSHPDNAACGFHLVVQCPLRAPGVLKYLGGYEHLAGNIVNPVQPEVAAKSLRDVELAA